MQSQAIEIMDIDIVFHFSSVGIEPALTVSQHERNFEDYEGRATGDRDPGRGRKQR
jgi:hypothetical protein